MRTILLVATLVIGAVGLAAVDLESGVSKWLELRGDLAAAEVRIQRLSREAADLERQVEALEAGGFELERAIREDLGFAKRGEVVVHFGCRVESGRGPRRPGGSDPWSPHRGE